MLSFYWSFSFFTKYCKIVSVKINLRIIVLVISTLTFASCTEKIYYSGKILNLNEDIYNFDTKKEIINYLGYPNYIDPIEKKYFYYSEKKISRNFYKSKIVYRILIVIHFNSNDTIKSIDEYDLENQNQVKLVKDITSSEIIKQGLLERVFGGVGKTPSMSP